MTKITDLELLIDEGVTLVDVTFVFDTGVAIYGDNLNFQFTNQEDALTSLLQVIDTLNANTTVPVGAGPNGTDQFFVGGDEENDLIGAVGVKRHPYSLGCTGQKVVVKLLHPEEDVAAVVHESYDTGCQVPFRVGALQCGREDQPA